MTDGAVESVIRDGLHSLAAVATAVAEDLAEEIEELASRLTGVARAGGTIFFCGNGGSAADAQHLAAEYVVRFAHERRAIAAVALTTDTSVLTAAGNDFGFETIFARQMEALGRPGDVLVLHSTSGESENLLLAAAAARARGVMTVALLARGGGRLASRVDQAVIIPSDSTARAQELHLAVGHIVCELVEQAISADG